MKTHNKPVIFIDFGEVYFHGSMPVVEKYSKIFGIPKKKFHKALMKNWHKYAEGKMNDKIFWSNVCKILNFEEEKITSFKKSWYAFSKPKDGMPKLVSNLRKMYRVAALSSINASWVNYLEKKFKISKRFHDHHYSFNHGIDKPDAKFFLSAAKKMNAEPEDCIVVDDNKKFLAAVKKTGAKIILFKDAKHLEKELKKLGVKI